MSRRKKIPPPICGFYPQGPSLYVHNRRLEAQINKLVIEAEDASTDLIKSQVAEFFNQQRPHVIVSSRFGHTLLVCEENNVYVFGSNGRGELGLGHSKTIRLPAKLDFFNAKMVLCASAGVRHTLVACQDGLYVFGCDYHGQLGLGKNVKGIAEPTKLKFFDSKTILAVCAGSCHSVIVCHDGLYVFGSNEFGQLGMGNKDIIPYPAKLDFFNTKKIRSVHAGWNHTFVNCREGLYVFGANDKGQLGLEDKKYSNKPIKHDFFDSKTILSVCVGSKHTLVLCQDGLYVFGVNNFNHEGIDKVYRPVEFSFFSSKTILSMCAGAQHTVVHCLDGLYFFGSNLYSHFGLGYEAIIVKPDKVDFFETKTILSIHAGKARTFVVCLDGVYVFGDNQFGCLGLGDQSRTHKPTKITGLLLHGVLIRRGNIIGIKQILKGMVAIIQKALSEVGGDKVLSGLIKSINQQIDISGYYALMTMYTYVKKNLFRRYQNLAHQVVSRSVSLTSTQTTGREFKLLYALYGVLFCEGDNLYMHPKEYEAFRNVFTDDKLKNSPLKFEIFNLVTAFLPNAYEIAPLNSNITLPPLMPFLKRRVFKDRLHTAIRENQAQSDLRKIKRRYYMESEQVSVRLFKGHNANYIICEDRSHYVFPSEHNDFNAKTIRFGAGGRHHTIVVCDEGVYGCGRNNFGQLGIGMISNNERAVRIHFFNTKTVLSVCTGYNHSIVICQDGLYVFGKNSLGQLGLGDTSDRKEPTKVHFFNNKTILSVCAAGDHTFVLCLDGLYAFGANGHRQLSVEGAFNVLAPVKLDFFDTKTILSVSAGHVLTLVACKDGLYVLGDKINTQSSFEDTQVSPRFTKLSFFNAKKIISIDTNSDESIIACCDGLYIFSTWLKPEYRERARFPIKVDFFNTKTILFVRVMDTQYIVACRDGLYVFNSILCALIECGKNQIEFKPVKYDEKLLPHGGLIYWQGQHGVGPVLKEALKRCQNAENKAFLSEVLSSIHHARLVKVYQLIIQEYHALDQFCASTQNLSAYLRQCVSLYDKKLSVSHRI